MTKKSLPNIGDKVVYQDIIAPSDGINGAVVDVYFSRGGILQCEVLWQKVPGSSKEWVSSEYLTVVERDFYSVPKK